MASKERRYYTRGRRNDDDRSDRPSRPMEYKDDLARTPSPHCLGRNRSASWDRPPPSPHTKPPFKIAASFSRSTTPPTPRHRPTNRPSVKPLSLRQTNSDRRYHTSKTKLHYQSSRREKHKYYDSDDTPRESPRSSAIDPRRDLPPRRTWDNKDRTDSPRRSKLKSAPERVKRRASPSSSDSGSNTKSRYDDGTRRKEYEDPDEPRRRRDDPRDQEEESKSAGNIRLQSGRESASRYSGRGTHNVNRNNFRIRYLSRLGVVRNPDPSFNEPTRSKPTLTQRNPGCSDKSMRMPNTIPQRSSPIKIEDDRGGLGFSRGDRSNASSPHIDKYFDDDEDRRQNTDSDEDLFPIDL